jgi:hypothetical protein
MTLNCPRDLPNGQISNFAPKGRELHISQHGEYDGG